MRPLDLRDVSFFVSVVDTGGISAAARALSAPKSSVSRGVARLENKLGVRLLHRSTRSLTLTKAGQSFYERASVALREMNEAASAAIEAREVPKGTVRVSAPLDVGAEVLPHLVARFIAAHPEVMVEVELSADASAKLKGRLYRLSASTDQMRVAVVQPRDDPSPTEIDLSRVVAAELHDLIELSGLKNDTFLGRESRCLRSAWIERGDSSVV